MATRQRTRLSAAVSADSGSILTILDEGALQQVLLAAKTAKVLGLLASSSRQLCSFARSRVPVHLCVASQEQAGLIIRSHASGRPPFSGCTHLIVTSCDGVTCCMALGVLHAAQQWTGLQQLRLYMPIDWQGGHAQEYGASAVLSGVPLLRQLRRFELEASAPLGICCAAHIQQLTQLTWLHLTATQQPGDAAADLTALSRLTNLVELRLDWALAPHLPAGPEGPYCLPSSLVTLDVYSSNHTSPVPMACWLAHLPGCKRLQHLHLLYGPEQHASVHPANLMPLLAQRHPQLCSFSVADGRAHLTSGDGGPAPFTWSEAVPGLPAAAAPVPAHWQPDASLAALKSLQSLSGMGLLCIKEQADWQHLAQATALTSLNSVRISSVPEVQAGSTLRLLQLWNGQVALSGYNVGRLLLACPLLQSAVIDVKPSAAPAVAAEQGGRLLGHPALQELHLRGCSKWGGPAAAAKQFAALAPVLSGVLAVDLMDWPLSSTREAQVMPDLSPCTALTSLVFDGGHQRHRREPPLEQEAILSMVAPLNQLEQLEVAHAPRVNARIALVLQALLPRLECVMLVGCGRLLPAPAAHVHHESSEDDASEDEEDADEGLMLQRVLQLLRAGLALEIIESY